MREEMLGDVLPPRRMGHENEFDGAVIEFEAALMTQAERACGLSDWGEDRSFQAGLRMHIADLLHLPPPQAGALRMTLVSLLVQRLTLIDEARRDPDIVAQDVGQPVFIIGIPRSGTTYTHALLALDPAARTPLVWEAAFPSPPPETATFTTDPRIARLGASMDEMVRLRPELRQIHDMKPLNEAECEQFMESHFTSLDLWASFDLPRTGRWIAGGAQDGFYAAHRRMLQQFQWHGPRGRWTLKSPDHLFRIPALLKAYPQACLVQTHRDPAKTMSSHASLVLALRKLTGSDCDPRMLGQEVAAVWSTALHNSVAYRRNPTISARIFDISYAEVIADPIGAIRRIHRHFDLPFTTTHEKRIEHKIREDRAERVQPHSYTAAEFGIDTMMEDFSDYRKTFAGLL